jgi:tetratricopeptide (TPR) repeat protein
MNINLQRGLMLYQQGRHEMAETELRQTLSAEPNDPYAHSLLALCLAERAKFDDATQEAQHAIHLQPDFDFAHYAHAHVLFDRRRLKEAQAAIEEAIRLDPANSDYFSLLSNIHFQESRWADALRAAEQGLQFDPESVTCTNLRAMAMVKLGRRAEAGATIDAALAKHPESSLTHANQGWTYLEKGQPDKALEHFREALRLNPENEWARHGIVEALKARHFIYAMMLKYFLWMSRFSARGQWGIILGAYFGNQLLQAIAHKNPPLAPYILPIRILYVCFALLTWLAAPFFNLMLRVNRFGRYALSREQTVASNWFGLCLLLGLLALVGTLIYGFDSIFFLGAIVFGFLLLPVSSVYNCASGRPRMTMAAIAIGLAAVGLGAIAVTMYENVHATANSRPELSMNMFSVFLFGTIASMWIANILRSRRPVR